MIGKLLQIRDLRKEEERVGIMNDELYRKLRFHSDWITATDSEREKIKRILSEFITFEPHEVTELKDKVEDLEAECDHLEQENDKLIKKIEEARIALS